MMLNVRSTRFVWSALSSVFVAGPVAAQSGEVVRIIQTNSAGTNAHLIDPETHEVLAVIEGLPHVHGVAEHPEFARHVRRAGSRDRPDGEFWPMTEQDVAAIGRRKPNQMKETATQDARLSLPDLWASSWGRLKADFNELTQRKADLLRQPATEQRSRRLRLCEIDGEILERRKTDFRAAMKAGQK